MQTTPLMKGQKLFTATANHFTDGLTSRNPSLEIHICHAVDTDERNPSFEHRSNDRSSKRLSFDPSPQLTEETEVDSADESYQLVHVSPRVGDIFRGKALTMNPSLTLSAYRRPENAIRLTNSDPSRLLEREYDLYAPKCGVLGHGAFSTVRLGVRRIDSLKVAIKSIAKHEALRSHRLRIRGRTYLEEWEILRRMKHNPYVVNLIDVFETDKEIQLVTEYCQGGELFDAIQKKRNRSQSMRRGQYTEVQASLITKQILYALADLHAQGLVHRDVKPENILLSTDSEDNAVHVKLCDFGIARVIREPSTASGSDGDVSPLTPGRTRSFSLVGSDYYMAPEVCFGGNYDTAVDIYSLGVTLYILLCGFPPVFSGGDEEEVIFPHSYWKDISEEAKDLVRKMLLPDVSERISARKALQHIWILSGAVCTSKSAAADPYTNEERSRIDSIYDYNTFVSKNKNNTNKSTTPFQPKRPLDGSSLLFSPPRKRRYERRASATLMALADLYRGVATSSAKEASSSPAKDRKSSFNGTTATVATLSF